MKRIIKGLSLLTVMVLSLLLLYPASIYALTEQTGYLDINDEERLEVGCLSFNDIKFVDYSSTSTLSFGLTGVVDNNDNSTVNYTVTVYYYDANFRLIASTSSYKMALTGTNDFNQMSNLNVLNNHKVSEIKYYRLSVDTSSYSPSSNLTPSESGEYSFYDYVIDKYNIDIIVNENNTLDITETITAYFNISKHGIYRTIPLKNTVKRLDGTTYTNHTKVTNLSVDNEYTVSRANGNYRIQIGSADKTVRGEQTYIIKYNYNLGKDAAKDYDELYFNIIGTEWDTVIGNITFNITMPKDFDSSKLGFSSGVYGSTNNSDIRYTVNGNKILGSYSGILKQGEGLTVRCELPDGYFVGAGIPVNVMQYVIIFIPLGFLGLSIYLWHKYGRDDQVIETVEFYPPEGKNSLDVGFLYKGKANNKDVTSLLIYLANKGYIKIEETEKRALFSKEKDFQIIKVKDYDGNDKNEEMFLKGLFKHSSTIDGKIVVTKEDLYDSFYLTMNKILFNINNKENRNKVFERSASSKSIFIILMIIVTYCLITIPPMLEDGDLGLMIVALLFPGLGFTVMLSSLVNKNDTVAASIISKAVGINFGLMFGGFPWLFIVLPTLIVSPIYLFGYVVGIICVFGMIICLNYLPKRTLYGNEVLGKLRGFKNFLETAEKDRLEAMVMQDPTYFYNILPYTYVLGVSDKWIKKFESISLQAPDWYDSPSAFDMIAFGHFMNTTMASAQSVMSSSPSSDSSGGGSFGGGSSGGGFSGGGSGGGGGGSW